MNRADILNRWEANSVVVVTVSQIAFALKTLLDATGTSDFVVSYLGGDDWSIKKKE